MAKKIDFDDLIRSGENIKALICLAKELYNNNMIGGTRKRLLDMVANDFEKTIEDEAYASLKAIELIKENEKLKQEVENLKIDLKHKNELSNDYIEHIDTLQNLHQQEIENLKYKIQYLIDVGLEKEQQYKELLKKCSPWLLTTNQCLICGGKHNHLDDCEYVRLCDSDINVGTKKGGIKND